MVWENGVTREYTAEEIAEMEESYQKAVKEGLITEDDESSVGGVGKIVPIRTFVVGDESTYRTHDDVTYLDGDETGTQITKIVLTETDDNRPIKVKYMFARVYLPKRTDITSNYGVAFLPYGLITTDEDGFAKGTSGYKLCSSSESAKSTNDNYGMVEVEFTDNFEYVFGRSTGYSTSQDSYAGIRNWSKNPYYLNGDAWGKIVMQKLCNAFNFHVYTSGVAFPSGAKVEIFGVEE